MGKLSKYVTDSDKMYGYRYEVDPIQQLMGTAMGWAGLPRQMAIYHMGLVPNPNGDVSYQILMEDVPIGAFWSITGTLFGYDKTKTLSKTYIRHRIKSWLQLN